MTGDDIKKARRKLGLSTFDLADVTHTSHRSILRWQGGGYEIPGSFALLIRLLVECPPAREWLYRNKLEKPPE